MDLIKELQVKCMWCGEYECDDCRQVKLDAVKKIKELEDKIATLIKIHEKSNQETIERSTKNW